MRIRTSNNIIKSILFLLLYPAISVAGANGFMLPTNDHYNVDNTNQPPKPDSDVPTLRLVYGINLGAYFANPSTANYYNGSGEHSIEEALNRIYNRDRLISNVDEIIADFQIGELPENMRYDPKMQIGFFGGLSFSNTFAVIGEFNYTKLTLADKFTLYTDKFTSTSEPYRLLSNIYGTEERIELRLGFQYTLITASYIYPYIETGINITDTKVIENRVNISGMDFNIREIRTEFYNVRDYGMGFGIYTGLGINMEVSDNFSFRLGGSVSMSKINLGNNKDIRPLYTLYVRLNLHEIF
jgi:hypothetical protein